MRAHTDTTAPIRGAAASSRPPTAFPSPALLARADRGFARVLAQHTEDQRSACGGEAPQR
ncbi:hypothetical protein ABZX93_32640 [Streptomyces sp. NPDC006632]|uniref:hypothetical protein n=1 Tax=Streptomyces sp. NPDC006632 TaxID=3157182 RepID=UPI0033A36D1E